MKRTRLIPILASLSGLALGACEPKDDGANAFRNGVPATESVTMKTPGAAGQGQALQGETAAHYQLTRAMAHIVNGGTASILGLVHAIVEYPATSVDGDTAVWGPHSEPLEPNAWKLTVQRKSAHNFHYVLEAKDKHQGDETMLVILDGDHTVSTEGGAPRRGFGSGEFTLNFDNSRKLPKNDGDEGVMHVIYSRMSPSSATVVDADFAGIRDDETLQLFDAAYAYQQTPGQGGSLDWRATQDYYPENRTTTTERENLSVRSRWNEAGEGRSDVKLSGGDATEEGIEFTVSECWDKYYASVYMTRSYDVASDAGMEADCPFTPAQYSSL